MKIFFSKSTQLYNCRCLYFTISYICNHLFELFGAKQNHFLLFLTWRQSWACAQHAAVMSHTLQKIHNSKIEFMNSSIIYMLTFIVGTEKNNSFIIFVKMTSTWKNGQQKSMFYSIRGQKNILYRKMLPIDCSNQSYMYTELGLKFSFRSKNEWWSVRKILLQGKRF